MRWLIKGADKKSGKKKAFFVTAESSSGAESWGASQGLLVESVTNTDPHNITASAGILRTIGTILILAAVLSLIGALATVFMFFHTGLSLALTCLGFGLITLAVGTVLKMLAAIGLTFRDAHAGELRPRYYDADSVPGL